MSDEHETTQPTPIDSDEYEKFRQFVEDVHGKVRGNLSTELENALRQYREGFYGDDRLERIEQDLATVKAVVAEAEGDGGVVVPEPAPTVSNDETTHTHRDESSSTDAPDEAPHPKASRAKKAEWVAAEHENDDQIARKSLRKTVETEYSFGEDATESLVEAAFDVLAETRETHPNTDEILVSPEQAEQYRENEREAAEDEADDEAATLDDAEPAYE